MISKFPWLFKRIPIIGEQDKKEPVKKTAVPYSHQKVITQFLKCIADCDMSDILKMVLRMKIWGIKPDVFYPLSYPQMAYIMTHDNIICIKNKTSTMQEIEKFLKSIDVFGAGKVHENNIVRKAINEVKELEAEGLKYVKDHLIRCGLLNIEYRFESRGADRISTWLGLKNRLRI